MSRQRLLVAATVAVGVTLLVNHVQFVLWRPSCADNFTIGVSASCVAPTRLDVPLAWLAPVVGLSAGFVVWQLMSSRAKRRAAVIYPALTPSVPEGSARQ